MFNSKKFAKYHINKSPTDNELQHQTFFHFAIKLRSP